MTTFSLSQEWVTKVTSSDEPDVAIIGASRSSLPTEAELRKALEEIAQSETVREMSRRQWIHPKSVPPKDRVAARGEALLEFFKVRQTIMPTYAMYKGRRVAMKRGVMEDLAVGAWLSYITDVASQCTYTSSFNSSKINKDFLKSVAQLSARPNGPTLALDAIREIGICVVLESSLPGMSIDGAAFHRTGLPPVIALTARHDRLDNFWFTLFHELGHVFLHLRRPSNDVFVDAEEEGDEIEAEAEANAFAKDSLIPRDIWLRSEAYRFGSEASVIALAKQLNIHPAIVAGRIRHERRNFKLFYDLIGRDKVRDALF